MFGYCCTSVRVFSKLSFLLQLDSLDVISNIRNPSLILLVLMQLARRMSRGNPALPWLSPSELHFGFTWVMSGCRRLSAAPACLGCKQENPVDAGCNFRCPKRQWVTRSCLSLMVDVTQAWIQLIWKGSKLLQSFQENTFFLLCAIWCPQLTKRYTHCLTDTTYIRKIQPC